MPARLRHVRNVRKVTIGSVHRRSYCLGSFGTGNDVADLI